MTARVLNFPGAMTAQSFLQQHWQKKPLRISGATSPDLPTLSGDELGWLATLEDVESRLVFTERSGDKTSYRVEHGPFAVAELEELPQQDWTLLIQDVDKHLPDFRAYLELTNFVSDWRIDDLMVSFAAPGGSVGPHQDNYDVFLCQGLGTRNWHLAEPGAIASTGGSGPLSLLDEFIDESPFLAGSGDVLYLPPGVPHFGIAITACVTYSIGMRAPTRADILDHIEGSAVMSVPSDTELFYQDPDLTIAEAIPGLITSRAIERVRKLLVSASDSSDELIAKALGMYVTDPKPWLIPAVMERAAASAGLAAFERTRDLPVHGMARLAYYDAGRSCVVFANGYGRSVTGTQVALVREMCQKRVIFAHYLRGSARDNGIQKLLLWLSQKGVFDL